MTEKPRFNWFQSDLDIVLTILKRGVVLEQCQVAYKDRHLMVKYGELVIFDEQLTSDVKSGDFTVQCTPSKVEIRMPKANRGERWASLTGAAPAGTVPTAPMVASNNGPSVSFAKKNWDAIEKQAVKEEEEEQVEGDAAVNKMFQKIYQDASDDVKKAMMKSYQESSGTVLSTNWADIGKRKVDVQPPECMEYKKFDS